MCPRDVLPHQCVHWTCACGVALAVCYDCAPGSIRPQWERDQGEQREGSQVTLYERLAQLREAHQENHHVGGQAA